MLTAVLIVTLCRQKKDLSDARDEVWERHVNDHQMIALHEVGVPTRYVRIPIIRAPNPRRALSSLTTEDAVLERTHCAAGACPHSNDHSNPSAIVSAPAPVAVG